ncbi:CRISPR-associated ring nuclease Csm6 [Crenalkalicoccus roseus]|uniref:CRISPR-associated ring nuclease Csm6 n=1 Tax=Crenalkalicoccus roseus TaxID=1485588 RepID=UPI0013053312|nr:CRISPR-associated ring nuclease Csm6 [Crenalkalicoccus roseus]
MPADPVPRPLHLLALAGLSPQVVTETIWCLARRRPPRLPSRITVLTTAAGRPLAERLLPPALRDLSAALGAGLPPPRLRLLRRRDAAPLKDIASDADNRAAADAILAAVAEATLDPATDVHLSIAGGRKTMGCLAAIALSLYGREGDCLSHVLVDPRLQGRADFFFPPAVPRRLPLPEGGTVSTAEHGLTLAEIPFVRLRARWRPGRDADAFSAAVAAAQEALDPPRLILDPARRQAHLGAHRLPLPPTLFAGLLWLAELARRGDAVPWWRTAEQARDLAAQYLAAMERVVRGSELDQARRALSAGMERTYLAEKVSRLNRAFRQALGPAAEPFLIRAEGRRPRTGYRLALPAEAITIIEDARGR